MHNISMINFIFTEEVLIFYLSDKGSFRLYKCTYSIKKNVLIYALVLSISLHNTEECYPLGWLTGVIHVSKIIYTFYLILLSMNRHGWSAGHQYRLLIYVLLIGLLVLLTVDPVIIPILNSNSHWKNMPILK